MNKIKKRLFKFINDQGVEIEKDVFSYGLSIVTTYTVFLMFLIPISLLNETFSETLTFIVVFVSLRQYLGGIHFNNPLICMIVSLAVAIIIPILAKNLEYIFPITKLVCFIFTFISINFIGTIDHRNKKLNNQEKKVFRIKANRTLVVYFIIVFLCSFVIPPNYINTIILTITLMNFNLIIPYVLQKINLNSYF